MKSYKKHNYIKGCTLFPRTSSLKVKRGFTLIEIMVSVSIFTVIITTGIGALVSIVNTYDVTQKQKKVHDGLNYALESMTREIRLGRDYLADADEVPNPQGSVLDGSNVKSIGFQSSDGRGYVVYSVIDGILLARRSGATNSAQDGTYSLTDSDELNIEDINFTVIGTDSGDSRQPLVWIRIRARAQGSDKDTVVQTLVSQRALDV